MRAERKRISISGGCPSRDGETLKTVLAKGSSSTVRCSVIESFSGCKCEGYGDEHYQSNFYHCGPSVFIELPFPINPWKPGGAE